MAQIPTPVSKIVRELRLDCKANWPTPSLKDSILFMVAEMGEFTDELMRLPSFMDVEPARNHPRDSDLDDVAEEAADVLIMLATTCDLACIDLEQALILKVGKLRAKYGGGNE